jgi:hypothetical protein
VKECGYIPILVGLEPAAISAARDWVLVLYDASLPLRTLYSDLGGD